MNRYFRRLARRAAALSVLALCTGACTLMVTTLPAPAPSPLAAPVRPPAAADPLDVLRYHEWTDVACHNCYVKGVDRFEHAFQYTRTLEIDITDQPARRTKGDSKDGKSAGTWYVRHDNEDKAGAFSDNRNNCGADEKSSTDLRGCLEVVRRFMDTASSAHVLTLYLDLKISRWSGRDSPAELDRLLLSILPPDRVVRPAQVLPQSKPAPADSGRARIWPQLAALRGRIIVVLTGGIGMDGLEVGLGTLFKRNQVLDDYMERRGDDAVAFVAAEVSTPPAIRDPRGIDKRRDPYIAFYNFGAWYGGEKKVGHAIRDRHGIGRIWWSEDSDPPSVNQCAGSRARFHRVAIYAIDKARPCSAVTRQAKAP